MKLVYPSLEDGEYINITRINDNRVSSEYFKSTSEASRYALKADKHYYNTYYSLATTDGLGRATENLKTRACLVWDFDKATLGEDFTHKTILKLFNSIRLYYHAIVDSGAGYHVYIFIQKTDDLEAVEAVQKAVAVRLGADIKATLKTQLMRVPGTVNIKHGDSKHVNIIHLADDEHIKRLPIEHYVYNYVTERYKSDNTNVNWIMRDKFTPKCVRDILEAGSKVGDRNADLQTLVVALKRQNKSLAEIRAIVDEWLENTQELQDLEYQVEYMYENLYNGTLNCRECTHKGECYVRDATVDTSPIDGFPILAIPNRDIKLITNSRRKRGKGKYMNGNMIVIYAVLMNHKRGLYKHELMEELTYKSEAKGVEPVCHFSDKTIRTTLKQLEENGFIEVSTINRNKFYKLKPNRVSENLKIRISYASACECIKGDITTSELELYCYMKYLNKVTPTKRGQSLNALQVNQEDLARDLGVDRVRITQMIQNLLDEKLLSIDYRAKSRNTNFMYNVYLLNY